MSEKMKPFWSALWYSLTMGMVHRTLSRRVRDEDGRRGENGTISCDIPTITDTEG